MSKGGRYLKKDNPAPKGGKGKKTVVIILIVLLVLVIGLGIAAIVYFNSLLNLIQRPDRVENNLTQEDVNAILGYDPNEVSFDETVAAEATEATEATETEPTETMPVVEGYGETGKIVNVLLIGQASREGEDSKLSDTIILLTINKETKTLTATSFLRDTFIQLPTPYKGHTCGMQRINVAYALGYGWGGTAEAMEYLDLAIENNFGVKIDYNVEVDFEAVARAIDLLGGLRIELDADEAKYMNNTLKDCSFRDYAEFVVGENRLDGWAGLTYARMRHSSGADNDFKRTNRQRVIIEKILDKFSRRSITQLNEFAKEMLPYVLTDMTNEEITTCMLELIPLATNLKLETNQCPAEGTYYGKMVTLFGQQSGVLDPDLEANKKILKEIAECD